jgi:hypothetical protein
MSRVGISDNENHSRKLSIGTFKGRLTTLDMFRTKLFDWTWLRMTRDRMTSRFAEL